MLTHSGDGGAPLGAGRGFVMTASDKQCRSTRKRRFAGADVPDPADAAVTSGCRPSSGKNFVEQVQKMWRTGKRLYGNASDLVTVSLVDDVL